MPTNTMYQIIGWRKGTVIERYGRRGVVQDDGEYRSTPTSGLWYATIRWDDGTETVDCPRRSDRVVSE